MTKEFIELQIMYYKWGIDDAQKEAYPSKPHIDNLNSMIDYLSQHPIFKQERNEQLSKELDAALDNMTAKDWKDFANKYKGDPVMQGGVMRMTWNVYRNEQKTIKLFLITP